MFFTALKVFNWFTGGRELADKQGGGRRSGDGLLEDPNMSVLGTGVAAGVAQTTLTAQQHAMQRDRLEARAARDARQVHDIVETHLQAVEEGDEPDSPGKLVINSEVPEHQHGGQQRDGKRRDAKQQPQDIEGDTTQPALEKPVIKHLDLRA